MAFVTLKLMDKYEYLDKYSENNSKTKILAGIVSLILILGVGLGVYLSTTQKTTTKTKASSASRIILESPKANEEIFGEYPIKAKLPTQIATKYLHGVLKIDDQDPQTFSLLKLDPETVEFSLDLDTKKITQGSHKLGVYIYDLSSGKAILIDSNNFNILIGN